MPCHICVTCGVQQAESERPPARCLICEDERQYVGWGGQRWTTLPDMAGRYRNEFEEHEPGLVSMHTEPQFGIGQRAFLIQTPAGNLLWDCISHLDEETLAAVADRGGIDAIAISHPHFYGTCVEWSAAFGDAPVYIHAADAEWVTRPSPRVVLWEGRTFEPLPRLTLVHVGGHFDGAVVVHWADSGGGQGALFTGDAIHVAMDRRFVSFMWSYANYIPLRPAEVRAIVSRLAGFQFDRIYGAFNGRSVLTDAAGALSRSAERYLARMGAEPADLARRQGT